MTAAALPIGLPWRRSIGTGHFAFGTTRDGQAVKVTTLLFGTLVLVESVDGQMMPTATIGSFDSAEAAIDAFGISVR